MLSTFNCVRIAVLYLSGREENQLILRALLPYGENYIHFP